MSMGEKLEGQCLSKAFQGWKELSSSIMPALDMAKHGSISLFSFLLLLLF